MKKSIIIGWGCIWITGGAYAAISPQVNCCQCQWQVGVTPRYAANCTDTSFCQGCLGTIKSTIINGVCTPKCEFNVGPVDPVDPIDPTPICNMRQYLDITKTCRDCPGDGTTGKIGGGKDITDCYLPAGTTGSDSTGTYTYTEDCHYSLRL